MNPMKAEASSNLSTSIASGNSEEADEMMKESGRKDAGGSPQTGTGSEKLGLMPRACPLEFHAGGLHPSIATNGMRVAATCLFRPAERVREWFRYAALAWCPNSIHRQQVEISRQLTAGQG